MPFKELTNEKEWFPFRLCLGPIIESLIRIYRYVYPKAEASVVAMSLPAIS